MVSKQIRTRMIYLSLIYSLRGMDVPCQLYQQRDKKDYHVVKGTFISRARLPLDFVYCCVYIWQVCEVMSVSLYQA